MYPNLNHSSNPQNLLTTRLKLSSCNGLLTLIASDALHEAYRFGLKSIGLCVNTLPLLFCSSYCRIYG